MNAAVGLVQSYLHVNGYFTVTGFPVVRSRSLGGVRIETGLDLLAFRLAGAGCEGGWSGSRGLTLDGGFEPDPALCCPADEPDMLIVDVGDGRPSSAVRDPAVLAAILARFGCCVPHEAADTVRTLLIHGSALSDCGYRMRLAEFEAPANDRAAGLHIPLAHAVRFLQRHLDRNWEVLRHAEWPDGALGLLAALKRTGGSAARAANNPDLLFQLLDQMPHPSSVPHQGRTPRAAVPDERRSPPLTGD